MRFFIGPSDNDRLFTIHFTIGPIYLHHQGGHMLPRWTKYLRINLGKEN